MTIAIDRTSGKVLGQVVDLAAGRFEELGETVTLLTKAGYWTLPRYQVRLETLR
jgi:hypothetical protein